MEKKKLLIDFDDVICTSVMLPEVNEFLGTNYKLSDFKDYVIDSVIPNDKKDEFYNKISNEQFYDSSKLMNGAKLALKKLSDVYDIYVLSSCVLINKPELSAPHFASKFNFLLKKLPFLDPKKFIFTSSKQMIKGDIMIDDYFDNLKADIPVKYLFNSYHNKDISQDKLQERNVERVFGWEDICNKLL